MKINLTQIKVRPSLLEEEKVLDVQKTIADLIWKECGKDDIAKASFALRLYWLILQLLHFLFHYLNY